MAKRIFILGYCIIMAVSVIGCQARAETEEDPAVVEAQRQEYRQQSQREMEDISTAKD